MDTEQKTLAQMTAEVVENNTVKGWYENCATFPEAMALLHSEVSEALETWRKWGLEDKTAKTAPGSVGSWQEVFNGPPKPEGVGSEFADIFIRLLDACHLFKVNLQAEVDRQAGRFAISTSFPDNMNMLHTMVAKAFMAWEEGEWGFVVQFAFILMFLRQLCEHYGIDLLAEYERKMQFNRTRPYRHGNKKI